MSCQINTIRKMQYYKLRKTISPITLLIGLMCHESYSYDGLITNKIGNELGIKPYDIDRINVKKKIIIKKKNKEVEEISLRDAKKYVRRGCNYCNDFSSEFSDISAGGVGVEGWTITIVRTDKGQKILDKVVDAGYLETRPIEEVKGSYDAIIKLSNNQKKRRDKFLSI